MFCVCYKSCSNSEVFKAAAGEADGSERQKSATGPGPEKHRGFYGATVTTTTTPTLPSLEQVHLTDYTLRSMAVMDNLLDKMETRVHIECLVFDHQR